MSEILSETQKLQVKELLQSYKDIFSEVPGRTNLLECRHELTTAEPINTPQYPLLFAMQEVAEKEVNDMLELEVIERSQPRYNSLIIVM